MRVPRHTAECLPEARARDEVPTFLSRLPLGSLESG